MFIAIALIYTNPVFQGKEFIQHDIVQYKGGAKELLDYRAKHGEETYWSDAMFGGMPTYQTGAQFRGDVIKYVDNALNFLPKPANYLFLLFAGFFLLGMTAVRNWKYALLGATFFGLSTYFYIIISAGHNGKVHTIAYFAPLLAGILLVYIRKKYLLGFAVTALFMGLQIAANHFQMTYYLFIGIGFLFLSELIRVLLKKSDWKHFGISSGVLALAFLLGIGMNSQRLLANREYAEETVRGKQILEDEKQNHASKDGMNRDAMLMWSYGKLETLNLFIPRIYGGSSQEKGSDRIMQNIQNLVQENATSQEEVDNIVKGFSSPTYWGEQPGTAGPAYQGAVVCFLVSVLFIDFVQLYNKFRSPYSILVVVELLFPLIAIVGLYSFFNNKNLTTEYKQKVLMYAGGGVLAFLLLMLVFGKSLLGFYTETEKRYLPPYILDYMIYERYGMFREDSIKAIFYVGAVLGVLFLTMKQKLTQNIALIIIGAVSFFDLWSVNKRYLNNDNFVDKEFVQEPFVTEVSDYLIEKAGDNTEVQRLLAQAEMNKTLSVLTDKDKGHYWIFNSITSPFNETTISYFKSSVGGYHAVKLRRYDDLINQYFSETDNKKTLNILNMLNTKYILLGSLQEPRAEINPNANGNAWFVSDIQFVKTPNEEIKAVGEIDNKKTAVVSVEDQKYFEGKNLQSDSTAVIELKNYQPNQLEFKTQSKTPQLAVFSEIYYPKGWKMLLDGKEVPYIKANYLLRAVFVPAGNHEVIMVFEPEVIEKGKMISMGAFGIFLLLSVGGFLKFRRKNTK